MEYVSKLPDFSIDESADFFSVRYIDIYFFHLKRNYVLKGIFLKFMIFKDERIRPVNLENIIEHVLADTAYLIFPRIRAPFDLIFSIIN